MWMSRRKERSKDGWLDKIWVQVNKMKGVIDEWKDRRLNRVCRWVHKVRKGGLVYE